MRFSQINQAVGPVVSKSGLLKMLSGSKEILSDNAMCEDYAVIEKSGNKSLYLHGYIIPQLLTKITLNRKYSFGETVKSWNDNRTTTLLWLEKKTKKIIPKKLITSAASAQQLSLVQMVYSLTAMLDYEINLMAESAKEIGRFVSKDEDAYEETPALIKELRKNYLDYATAVNTLSGNPDKVKSEFKKLPVTIITRDTEELATATNNFINAPLYYVGSQFVGNPIYHALKWWTDIGVSIIKARQSKKQQLELVRTDVEAELRNAPSPALKKELGSLNQRIKILDYKIKQAIPD